MCGCTPLTALTVTNGSENVICHLVCSAVYRNKKRLEKILTEFVFACNTKYLICGKGISNPSVFYLQKTWWHCTSSRACQGALPESHSDPSLEPRLTKPKMMHDVN